MTRDAAAGPPGNAGLGAGAGANGRPCQVGPGLVTPRPGQPGPAGWIPGRAGSGLGFKLPPARAPAVGVGARAETVTVTVPVP